MQTKKNVNDDAFRLALEWSDRLNRGISQPEELPADLPEAMLNPHYALLAYGTLRVGQSHAYLLDMVRTGDEPIVQLWGTVDFGGPYPFFEFSPTQHNSVVAELIRNPNLPLLWKRLDAYEGDEYERIIVPYQHQNIIGLASIYARKPSWPENGFSL